MTLTKETLADLKERALRAKETLANVDDTKPVRVMNDVILVLIETAERQERALSVMREVLEYITKHENFDDEEDEEGFTEGDRLVATALTEASRILEEGK